MAKRDSDGDVIFNKISLKLASFQRLIDSVPDASGKPIASTEESKNQDNGRAPEDENFGPDRAGVGSKILKEIEDGTFGRRTLTSEDKLLEQIMGSKAARAHKAAKQAPKDPGRPQKFQKSFPSKKPVDSDDEEEGRSSAFTSKRRKTGKSTKTAPEASVDELEHGAVAVEVPLRPSKNEDQVLPDVAEDYGFEEENGKEHSEEPQVPAKQQQKVKPKSFLDEILAERSNKKKKKKKPAGTTLDG